jgi:predicted ester cyclase
MFLAAFPDLHATTDDVIAEREKVVWRFTSTATHNGPFMGIPPTGKRGIVTGIVIFRLENSQIVEGWVNLDTLGLLQQLGVVPAAPS